MSYWDFYSDEHHMHMRVEEERHQAELRRLQREAGKARQGRLFQWRRWVLCQLGRLFASVGRRLEHSGQAQAPCAQEQASGRA
jgi:hypothetical protein